MRKAIQRLAAASVFAFLCLAFGSSLHSLRAEDWQPITPEEMALKDDPANPGASAIILYREEFTDDERDYDLEHHRIKILKEEGKKYADVEMRYLKGVNSIDDIKARTVQPDGSSTEFKGEIYEKTVWKVRGVRYLAKTLTLPNVQAGSIIEYKYKTRRSPYSLYDSRWIIQRELTTRKAHFSILPYSGRSLAWLAYGLGTRGPEARKDRSIHLQLDNIPPFQEEEFIPPEETLKARVSFFYMPGFTDFKREKMPDEYWNWLGKSWFKMDEQDIGKRKGIQRALAALIQEADSPEMKLQKIYGRMAQIRNLSFERSKTEKEEKREKLKDNQNVEDVLERGYGYGSEINQLFAALARAAGFEASIIYAASRSSGFFDPQIISTNQLSANLVQVRMGQQEWYLDPATRFCPFKMLPWQETAVRGIRPEKEGSSYVTTPGLKSTDAITERQATLQMDREGNLEGTVQITYHGQEALDRRLEHRHDDDAGRRKALEDEVKDQLPAGSTVELTRTPAWEQTDEKLLAEFHLKVLQAGAATGRRILLPLGIFQAQEKYPFRNARRIHPIYFSYPFQEIDDVTIELPSGLQVESLPAARKKGFPHFRFEISRTAQGNKLRLERRLIMEGNFFRVDAYPILRIFYDSVRAGDEEQIVLKAVEPEPPK